MHLGDAVVTAHSSAGLRGLVLYSGSTFGTFVSKTLVADTYYKVKIDTRGDTIRAKLWASSAAEPIAWDSTLTKVDETVADISDMDIVFSANTTPGNMKLSMAQILAQIGGEVGGPVVTGLPPGDGSTTTWTIEPFSGPPTVWVDGLLTVVTFDTDAGTITFDRAPANGAQIRIKYVPT